VAEIDSETEGIHSCDGDMPRVGKAGVAWLETAIAEGTAIVIGELHDAFAEITEPADSARVVFQRSRVLFLHGVEVKAKTGEPGSTIAASICVGLPWRKPSD
jgi:hypothetical protein